MAREKSEFSCSEGGATSPKWLGKCPGCGAWNTLVEGVAESAGRHRFQALAKSAPGTTLASISASVVTG
ncbi:MAG TPA: DNA repair protein RadA, partial [Burkholderiaceae bacterium]|nr:DNA repair protein RadA [Burkholderiaceae bacterium]